MRIRILKKEIVTITYLSTSPVVFVGAYPFSDIHVTPRISFTLSTQQHAASKRRRQWSSRLQSAGAALVEMAPHSSLSNLEAV